METIGLTIKTKPSTKKYRDGWDKVFAKPKKKKKSPTSQPR